MIEMTTNISQTTAMAMLCSIGSILDFVDQFANGLDFGTAIANR
jgi:hypothetical protein